MKGGGGQDFLPQPLTPALPLLPILLLREECAEEEVTVEVPEIQPVSAGMVGCSSLYLKELLKRCRQSIVALK